MAYLEGRFVMITSPIVARAIEDAITVLISCPARDGHQRGRMGLRVCTVGTLRSELGAPDVL